MGYRKKYVRRYGKPFTFSFLLVAGEAVCDLLQPALLARMIDEGVSTLQLDTVLRIGGLMLLVTLAGAIMASGRNVVSSRVSQAFGAELRSDLFRKIQTLPMRSLDRFDRASLVTRLTNDVTQVQNFANGMMRIFAKAPILCIGSLIMAVNLNPRLSLVLLIVVPLVAIIIGLNFKVGFPLFSKVQVSLDKLNGGMREYLAGVRVVKAFNRFPEETDKFERSNDEYKGRSQKAMRVMAFFNPSIVLAVNLGIVGILWLGASRVDEGSMQVGHIVAFVNYMTQILFSLMLISMVINMLVRAKVSGGRIADVLTLQESDEWQPNAEDRAVGHGHIRFQGVSFSYGGPSGEPVLKDIDLDVLPGQTIGIIGSTGSGKSTLVQLIPRFYEATAGRVAMNGVDVRELDPSWIREKVALVPQRPVLFTGTIRDNIRWGNDKATEEEVARSARLSAADGFIRSLPDGYDTKLGQGGVNLSGGQKQRLSIARALIRKPEVLILDDCTSAVDVTTEAAIKESLRQFAQGMTCIMIAQRITSVMDLDQIVVLDHGEIVGKGKHDELLRDCRVYQEIYHSQIGKEMHAHGV
ncbi:ABC transporter ATP-binding protein [Cohnella thailandensis]|uniref:ABC transporter ATP-binding protein n=1 Tax=Cohnella thailandensis TaxID=557557 RepID=A0A841SY82_9BACL|nr:ABC transporter ATP-binding protein [Cohnella thailandensis]MBB6636864.1 ABC transporter ATP-binding protein [Cohnella thailandensis]MBP1973256.1 ATP-binding cassette subfamily B protein [Cohnella thailandensis]